MLRPSPPGPRSLDPSEFNLASAWWGPPNVHFPSGWRAFHHGAGVTAEHLAGCCPLCDERLEQLRPRPVGSQLPTAVPPAPEPPRTVDVGPVRAHVRELLATGVSREAIAVTAGIDATTIGRVLLVDVPGVLAKTATALLAVQ